MNHEILEIAGDTEISRELGQNEVSVFVLLLRAGTSSFTVRLGGHGARADVRGIIMGQPSAAIRLTTLQHHGAPDTESTLLVKSIVPGGARSEFSGVIRIDPTAQKSNAYQRNENLLLDKTAKAVSVPTLEILANDVRCTHGATVGTVPSEELWYLESRGIPATEARKLYVQGFVRQALTGLDDEIVDRVMRDLPEYI